MSPNSPHQNQAACSKSFDDGHLYAAPTRVFADLSFGAKRDGVDAGLPGAAFVPGLVAFAGGLPVTTAAGDVIGGIGVSEDQDEACAQAGLDATSDVPK